MPSLATSLPTQAVLVEVSHRLGCIWRLLGRGIGLWSSRERAAPLPTLTHARVARLVARLQALLAILAAGRRPRVYPPRPACVDTARDHPRPKPQVPRLPRRIGWLMPKDIEIRAAASQLTHWLADPAIVALLAEVPRARRPLAALCRMLAIPPWPHPPDGPHPVSKPRVRKLRPRKPRPSAAEDRAASWHHRSIETDHGVRTGKRPWWVPPTRR